MTREEAIRVIKIERQCVERNWTQNNCDRDCINCDLLMPESDIFSAYDIAIKALEQQDAEAVEIVRGEQNVL